MTQLDTTKGGSIMAKNYNKKILTLHMRLNRSADVRVRKLLRAEIERLAQEERELKNNDRISK